MSRRKNKQTNKRSGKVVHGLWQMDLARGTMRGQKSPEPKEPMVKALVNAQHEYGRRPWTIGTIYPMRSVRTRRRYVQAAPFQPQEKPLAIFERE